MKISASRLKASFRAMGIHFVLSLLVTAWVAFLVFVVWFPYPFREFAGGKDLFFLIVGVDLVCGPLLTLVIYAPTKRKRELVLDMGLVVIVQLAALCYGAWTMYQVRPLYLVHEIDRFKVISLADVDSAELASVPKTLKVGFFEAPKIVSLRELSAEERKKVLIESVQGGRDYGDHPNFYVPFKPAAAYTKARPLATFLQKYPRQQQAADQLISINAGLKNSHTKSDGKPIQPDLETTQIRYLPLIARKDWIVVLGFSGEVMGYLEGDGF